MDLSLFRDYYVPWVLRLISVSLVFTLSQGVAGVSTIDSAAQSVQTQVFMPVSLTVRSPNEVFVADYWNVYLASRSDSDERLPFKLRIMGLFGDTHLDRSWTTGRQNPTGLQWDSWQSLLYIANYTGRNILVAEYEPGAGLHVVREIHNQEMVSPENVWADGSKDLVLVADYAGSKILAFDTSGRLRWHFPLRLAHGITVVNDTIYATGLGGHGHRGSYHVGKGDLEAGR